MAYAAILSLLQILKQIQNNCDQFSTDIKSQIQLLYEGVRTLKDILLQRVPKLKLRHSIDFENQIRDAIREAEDIIESHTSTHFLSSEEDQSYSYSSIFTQDLQRVIHLIDFIRQKLSEVYKELDEFYFHENLYVDGLLFRKLMVGRDKDIDELKVRLTVPTRLDVIPIVGVSGIGKTALAEFLYKDQLIMDHFETRAWIKLSPKYRKRDVLIDLLRSMKRHGASELTDDQLVKSLYKFLRRRRYLIVLDNIHDVEFWNDLRELFPDFNNGSRVMLTSRNMDEAHFGDTVGPLHQLTFLSRYESWDLLHEIIFEDGRKIDPELQKVAMRIAKNCQGLPLAIVLIGKLLPWIRLTDWKKIASSIHSCGNYVELIEVVVSLTYNYLPLVLKPCFLYMGIFPHDYEIITSALFKLWIGEGFIVPNETSSDIEDCAYRFLWILINRGLVSVPQMRTDFRSKTCRINDVFLDFLMNKAKEEKLFHIINENTYGFLEGTDDQRRLCIHKNICFGIKDVSRYNTMASISTARSFIYFGQSPEYPLPAWLAFKLLRVLDVLKIRFYKFPIEILKLFQLTYLALSYNGELPASVCKLRNLQVLIVHRYLNIKRPGAPLYLPMEIWNMKELRHLQVMGSDLPDPSTDSIGNDGVLENLVTLLHVSAHSCRPRVLQNIPNLKKLGIQTESISADNGVDTFSFLSNLLVLKCLESLKCIVLHPDARSSQVVSSIPIFPPSLKKITLAGCKFSWEYMKVIGSLPELEILKLRCYAFVGPEWASCERGFPELKYLLLEDLDLEYLSLSGGACFPNLEQLIIRHCYKLRDISINGTGRFKSIRMMEVDCCPSLPLISAPQIREVKKVEWDDLEVQFYQSWEE